MVWWGVSPLAATSKFLPKLLQSYSVARGKGPLQNTMISDSHVTQAAHQRNHLLQYQTRWISADWAAKGVPIRIALPHLNDSPAARTTLSCSNKKWTSFFCIERRLLVAGKAVKKEKKTKTGQASIVHRNEVKTGILASPMRSSVCFLCVYSSTVWSLATADSFYADRRLSRVFV